MSAIAMYIQLSAVLQYRYQSTAECAKGGRKDPGDEARGAVRPTGRVERGQAGSLTFSSNSLILSSNHYFIHSSNHAFIRTIDNQTARVQGDG